MDKSISHQNHEYFMKQALELARKAAKNGEVPVGALIVNAQGEIISQAFNQREQDKSALAHAEILAISRANQSLNQWRLEQCRLYVTLEPCPMCAGAIWASRLSEVIYGASDPKSGYIQSLHKLGEDPILNHHFKVSAGILEEDCAQLLKTFFQNLRSVKV